MNRFAKVLIASLIVAAGAMLLVSGVAYGSTDKPVKRGQPCTLGERGHNRSGVEYVCEQRPGDKCPVFHAAHPTRGTWPKPSPCLCPSHTPSTSPTPGRSASNTPPASHGSNPSRTSPTTAAPAPDATPAGQQLPITGTADVVGLVGAALLFVGAGVLFIVMPGITRRGVR